MLKINIDKIKGNIGIITMGDKRINFWKHYRKEDPLSVMVVGKSKFINPHEVERPNSEIIAIEYILSGECSFRVKNQSFKAVTGDVVLLPKNTYHFYGDKLTHLEKYWIVIDGTLIEQLLQVYIPNNIYLFNDCNIKFIFHDIYKIVEKHIDNYEVMVDEIAQKLFQIILILKQTVKKTNFSLAEQIRTKLDSQIEKQLTLDELCNDLNYSKNHIIRIFKREYGLTPYNYLMHRKIDVAKLYLKNTRFSIKEIADILDYSDQNYFSNSFRQIEGCSPLKYRKENFTNKGAKFND